jgi:hypothetical protein
MVSCGKLSIREPGLCSPHSSLRHPGDSGSGMGAQYHSTCLSAVAYHPRAWKHQQHHVPARRRAAPLLRYSALLCAGSSSGYD